MPPFWALPVEESDDVQAAERHYRFRLGMSFAVAAAHATLAVLGVAGRLSYSTPSRYPLLIEVTGSPVWIWFHVGAALAITAAILTRRRQVWALSIAAGAMGCWSFFSLLWGLSVPSNPVSLAGPAMGGMVAILAALLSQSWARSGDREGG